MKRTALIVATLFAAMPHALAQNTVNTAYLACRTDAEAERFNRIRQSGDTEALQKYLTGSLLSGMCTHLPAGSKVFVEGQGSAGRVKIRPQGSIDSYFFPVQFIN